MPVFELDVLPTIDELRDTGNHPRVHGNGFIQLDLTDELRLHVWGVPEIPRQKVASQVHDHVFSFRSMCHVGRMLNVCWNVIPSLGAGSHRLWQAQPADDGHDTRLVMMNEPPVFLSHKITQVILPGKDYHVFAFRYHESVPTEPTVTIIEKDGDTLVQDPGGYRPKVCVPVGVEPDNEFNRDGHDQILLWMIIDDTLRKAI